LSAAFFITAQGSGLPLRFLFILSEKWKFLWYDFDYTAKILKKYDFAQKA
jgi:hypothetical protein